MLQYFRTDMSIGIDVSNDSGFHEFIICHYWSLSKTNFEISAKYVANCHNLTQKVLSFKMLQLFELLRL